jgi:hypothetical protein
MADDVRLLIRATYNNALMVQGHTHSAFDCAVEVFLARRPLLSMDDAQGEVAAILGVEAVSTVGDR